jgi:hypothetical protein
VKRDARPDDAKYVAIARAERPLPARGVHFFEVPQLFYLVSFPHLTLPSFFLSPFRAINRCVCLA